MGYGIKSYVDGFLVLLGIKAESIMKKKADALREEIRQKLIEGRDRHTVVAKIIKHAQAHYDYWERAAVSQVMGIYKVNKANAIAIVAEMHYYSLDTSRI